jgi:hypothetical protein
VKVINFSVQETLRLRWACREATRIAGWRVNGHAACNDANNWFEALGQEIKAFVGYGQEQKPVFGDFGVVRSATYYPYPEPLHKEMLGTEGTGALLKDETSDVSYLDIVDILDY